MIKLNDTTAAASINTLADSELDQVVGGCHGWGKKRGYGKNRGHDKSYDKGYGEGGYETSAYEPEESYDDSSGDVVQVNDQNIELNITINQVAG